MFGTIFFVGFALIGGTLSGMGGCAIGKQIDKTKVGQDTGASINKVTNTAKNTIKFFKEN